MNPDAKIGFENGQRVPIVEPEVYRELTESEVEKIRSETLRLLFDLILADGADALEAGVNAHLLAWKCGCHPALPTNQTALADAAGVSQSAVSRQNKKCESSNVFNALKAPSEKTCIKETL